MVISEYKAFKKRIISGILLIPVKSQEGFNMSFADELRSNSLDSINTGEIDDDVAYWCGRLTRAVRHVCREAALEGKRRIFGYVHMSLNEGRETISFDQSLPLTKNLGTRMVVPEEKGRYDSADGYSYINARRYETRLYEGYIIPGDIKVIQKIEDVMREELEGLGFTEFRVQKVRLMDIYVIHYRKGTAANREVVERISTRTAPEPVYTLHFSIEW